MVFQVEKALFGGMFKIGEEGDGGNIQVTILIKVSGLGLGGTGQGEEEGLFKAVISLLKKDTNAVVGLQYRGVIGIVAVGIEEVQAIIPIKVGQFNVA